MISRYIVAYEFYWDDEIKGAELMGILLERRKKSERITHESIINWGRKFFGNANTAKLFFVQVKIDRNTGEIFGPDPFFGTA